MGRTGCSEAEARMSFSQQGAASDRGNVLHEISQSLLQSSDLQSFLEESVDRIMPLGPFDAGVIALMVPNGESLTAAVSRGYREERHVLAGTSTERHDQGAVRRFRSLAGHRPFIIEDLEHYDGYRSFKEEGLRSVVVVPIYAGDAALGLMWLGTRAPRKFPEA